MRPPTEIVKRVRQTEKGARVAQHDQYLLEVSAGANKPEIRKAVEELFNVEVRHVNTLTTHGKWRRLQGRRGRRPDSKNAIVTLAEGEKIEVKS